MGVAVVRAVGMFQFVVFFFFSSRRRHTRSDRDWSSDVCSSDLSVRGLETRGKKKRADKRCTTICICVHLLSALFFLPLVSRPLTLRIPTFPPSQIGRASCRERV